MFLQSGEALIYYKAGQESLQRRTGFLCYKAGQIVLQSKIGITKWSTFYYEKVPTNGEKETSRTSSERLMCVQFTSCVYGFICGWA